MNLMRRNIKRKNERKNKKEYEFCLNELRKKGNK